MDETKLTAALPNLDVQIVHREYPEERAEVISITFRATPDFESVARGFAPMLGGAFANPMFTNPMLALWVAPVQAWTTMVRQAWAPWLSAMGATPRIERK
ncbi:MAG TPA: hypothetical protein VGE72_08865 [Azospirillum sp.]